MVSSRFTSASIRENVPAGGLVGNFTGEADFLDQQECIAGAPRIYGQLVGMLGKYSKFASAGDKAAVRQTLSVSVSKE